MKRGRLVEIERLKSEHQAGLVSLSVDELWDLVDELLPDAELAGAIDLADPEILESWRNAGLAPDTRRAK